MYKIKQIPEDFIVEEVSDLDLNEFGKYAYYILEKINYNTIDAIEHISNVLHVNPKHVNFAGTKDRNAKTTQYVSIFNGPKKDYSWKDIELNYVGQAKERLNLGSLKGNKFVITVRNLDSNFKPNKNKECFAIPNYFGNQRFGNHGDNAKVGELILNKKFKEAIELIRSHSNDDNDQKILNPINELRKIPKRLLIMYIHAFQSEIWNETVSEFLKKYEGTEINGLWYPLGLDETNLNLEIPLVGFGTDLFMDDEINRAIKSILDSKKMTIRDFIIREMPEVCSEGTERNLFVDVKDFEMSNLEKDDLNEGMNKITVTFFLPKGCYATTVINALFGT